jgi:hypothetical protein
LGLIDELQLNMPQPIRYVAEPKHVREVSLRGSADLDFWTTRLKPYNLLPVSQAGRAQLLIIGAEMSYMGIRFTEISFAILVSAPERPGQSAVYLRAAFNSSKLVTWSERVFFHTPYRNAKCHVLISKPASISISLAGRCLFDAQMGGEEPNSPRSPARFGVEGWEVPIFLPLSRGCCRGSMNSKSRVKRRRNGLVYFGKVRGETAVYSFAKGLDRVSIAPTLHARAFLDLIDSGFRGEEWSIRPDACHGRSKTFARRKICNST